MSIESLLQFVDQETLDLTEEQHESFPRASLFQGNKSLEDVPEVKGTVRHTGGIGFQVDECPERILQAEDGAVCKTEKGTEFKVFPHLDIVVLATSRVRRFFQLDSDGKTAATCGTNQDGVHAVGWADGQLCATCPLKSDDYIDRIKEHDDQKKCQGQIPVLVYIPRFDYTCLMIFKGGSYMPASEMLKEVNRAGREFAKRPEIQAASPGLKRVNSFFFNIRIKASEFISGGKRFYNALAFEPYGKPINWEAITNSPDVIAKAKETLEESQEQFKAAYVNERDNAKPIAALTGGTEPAAAEPETGTKATVEEVEVKNGQVVNAEPTPPAQPAAAAESTPAQPAQAEAPPPKASSLGDLEAL